MQCTGPPQTGYSFCLLFARVNETIAIRVLLIAISRVYELDTDAYFNQCSCTIGVKQLRVYLLKFCANEHV